MEGSAFLLPSDGDQVFFGTRRDLGIMIFPRWSFPVVPLVFLLSDVLFPVGLGVGVGWLLLVGVGKSTLADHRRRGEIDDTPYGGNLGEVMLSSMVGVAHGLSMIGRCSCCALLEGVGLCRYVDGVVVALVLVGDGGIRVVPQGLLRRVQLREVVPLV